MSLCTLGAFFFKAKLLLTLVSINYSFLFLRQYLILSFFRPNRNMVRIVKANRVAKAKAAAAAREVVAPPPVSITSRRSHGSGTEKGARSAKRDTRNFHLSRRTRKAVTASHREQMSRSLKLPRATIRRLIKWSAVHTAKYNPTLTNASRAKFGDEAILAIGTGVENAVIRIIQSTADIARASDRAKIQPKHLATALQGSMGGEYGIPDSMLQKMNGPITKQLVLTVFKNELLK